MQHLRRSQGSKSTCLGIPKQIKLATFKTSNDHMSCVKRSQKILKIAELFLRFFGFTFLVPVAIRCLKSRKPDLFGYILIILTLLPSNPTMGLPLIQGELRALHRTSHWQATSLDQRGWGYGGSLGFLWQPVPILPIAGGVIFNYVKFNSQGLLPAGHVREHMVQLVLTLPFFGNYIPSLRYASAFDGTYKFADSIDGLENSGSLRGRRIELGCSRILASNKSIEIASSWGRQSSSLIRESFHEGVVGLNYFFE